MFTASCRFRGVVPVGKNLKALLPHTANDRSHRRFTTPSNVTVIEHSTVCANEICAVGGGRTGLLTSPVTNSKAP